MIPLLQRIHRSAAVWSFLATTLRMGANVFILPLVLHLLSKDDYGVWAVFGAIGGFAALLDLGFEQTITRMTSYAWGGAVKFVAFGIHQDETAQPNQNPNLTLLRELIATLRAYYFYVGMVVLVLLMAGGGIWIWFTTRGLVDAQSLRLAWLVFAGGCWFNFVIGRWPALLNGIGAIREAQAAAIISQLVYYVVVSVGLLAGYGVWALVVAYVSMGFVARYFGKRFFVGRAELPGGLPRAHFHKEIFNATWPNAWRTGMVSIGAFLTVYANTLICNAFLGLTTTGSYNLSFQLVNLLFGLCNVWVIVKLPAINALRLQGRNDEIVNVFARRVRLTLLCYLAGTLVIIFVAPMVLPWVRSNTHLMATGPLAALALFRLLELHHTMYAMLVMSENQNPFLKSSLISGAAIVIASLILTPMYGLWGMILSMGVVQLCYNNWWPVLRALQGLGLKPGTYFAHHYLRPKAWLELF